MSNYSHEEVNLSSVLARLRYFFGGLIHALGLALLHIIRFSLRHRIVLLIVLVLGFSGGLLYYFHFTKRYYESVMVASTKAVEEEQMIHAINSLAKLTEEKQDYPLLAKKLGLSVADASKIKHIEAYWYIDEDNDGVSDYVDYSHAFVAQDTIMSRLENRFEVRVLVTDLGVISSLADALVFYAHSNPMFDKAAKLYRKQLNTKIAKIDDEINELDSLQTALSLSLLQTDYTTEATNQIVIKEQERQVLFHKDVLDLLDKRQDMEYDLAIDGEILNIEEDFIASSKPIKIAANYILEFTLLFLMITVFILLIIDGRKKLRQKLAQLDKKMQKNEPL